MTDTKTQWAAVDAYLEEHLIGADPVLSAALENSRAAGLPPINVPPTQGKLLYLLTRLQRAVNILEVGTLAGYGTIWLARALPAGGRIVTLESEARHADVARANLARAGVLDRVDLRVGPALDTLAALAAERGASFDLVFIDADKPRTSQYIEASLQLSRPGTLLIVDNIIRNGELANAATTDEKVQGMQRAVELMARHPQLDATAIQTVGGKGYDGFAVALVS
jgi:predicted O-methyltransferase YrrM